jgi:hypothetical protein
MVISPTFLQYAQRALPNLAVGLGAMGAAGWVGAHGDPQGIPAGMFGSPGGGFRGAISGGILGAIAGAGLIGVSRMPGMAPKIGGLLASLARSAPVQRTAAFIGSIPGPGFAARQNVPRIMASYATTPHQEAARFLQGMLEQKKASLLAAAGLGGFGGALAGIPVGALRGAYLAGDRTVGPMGAG